MQQILLTCLVLLVTGQTRAEKLEIFEHGLTWDQIKAKARVENKYIFLDCFATWCGPCKEMDREVYTDKSVGEFLNDHFISVKVQMDTSKADDQEVQSWYPLAHNIMKEYNLKSFPTYIFLSPEGNIVHKGIGFMDVEKFLKLLNQAINPEEQYYSLLETFHKQHLSYSIVPGLVKGLERIGEKDSAMNVANWYIENYLLKLNGPDLFRKENLRFVGSHIKSAHSQGFNWYYHHVPVIDNVMGKGYSTSVIDNSITKEVITPMLLKWDSLGNYEVQKRDWANLRGTIRKEYNDDYAKRIVLDAQIRWYSYKQQWDEMVYFHVKKIETYGLDASEANVGTVNNIVYYVIFQHSKDKAAIDKAIKWMKIICEKYPQEQDYLDTYANLLYKKGETQKAISLEEKAFSMNTRNDAEIIANMEKMKKGQPTWTSN